MSAMAIVGKEGGELSPAEAAEVAEELFKTCLRAAEELLRATQELQRAAEKL